MGDVIMNGQSTSGQIEATFKPEQKAAMYYTKYIKEDIQAFIAINKYNFDVSILEKFLQNIADTSDFLKVTEYGENVSNLYPKDGFSEGNLYNFGAALTRASQELEKEELLSILAVVASSCAHLSDEVYNLYEKIKPRIPTAYASDFELMYNAQQLEFAEFCINLSEKSGEEIISLIRSLKKLELTAEDKTLLDILTVWLVKSDYLSLASNPSSMSLFVQGEIYKYKNLENEGLLKSYLAAVNLCLKSNNSVISKLPAIADLTFSKKTVDFYSANDLKELVDPVIYATSCGKLGQLTDTEYYDVVVSKFGVTTEKSADLVKMCNEILSKDGLTRSSIF